MDFFDLINFPSKSDWTFIMNEFPIIRQLSIQADISVRQDSINNIGDFLTKPNDFLNWTTRLVNKLGKLRFSYVLLIYYSKNLSDKNWIQHNDDGSTHFFPEFKEADHYKKFMFDYFTENFYYHYFSSVDIISFLLNIYYNLNVNEGMQFSKNVQSKIPDRELKDKIDEFLKNIKVARNNRNKLTHNFPFNEVDMRSQSEPNNVHVGKHDYRPSSDTITEIHEIIKKLEKILRAIETQMKNVA